MSICESVTVYGDERDLAIFWAEFLNTLIRQCCKLCRVSNDGAENEFETGKQISASVKHLETGSEGTINSSLPTLSISSIEVSPPGENGFTTSSTTKVFLDTGSRILDSQSLGRVRSPVFRASKSKLYAEEKGSDTKPFSTRRWVEYDQMGKKMNQETQNGVPNTEGTLSLPLMSNSLMQGRMSLSAAAESISGTFMESEIDPADLPDLTQLLDVDFISSSTVQFNADDKYHCYFDLSREVIDDARELIIFRHRADHRKSRLIRREGNLFDFLIAPPHVHH